MNQIQTEGFPNFGISVNYSYVAFERMLREHEPLVVMDHIEGIRKELRTEHKLVWANEPRLTVTDIFGHAYGLLMFKDYITPVKDFRALEYTGSVRVHLYPGLQKGWTFLPSDRAGNTKTFADMKRIMEMYSRGQTPCVVCGAEGKPAEKGEKGLARLGGYCDKDWAEYFERHRPSYGCKCPKSFVVPCVCAESYTCPEHGGQCVGSHD